MRLTHLLVMCFDFSLSIMVNSVLTYDIANLHCQSFKVIFSEHKEKIPNKWNVIPTIYIFLYDKCHMNFL